ncbi:MAG: hypothetical protein M3T55_13405, partial [Pseudomonadota bacterium]|nr:hypothetical protein [Pseudomonadota bacterium]
MFRRAPSVLSAHPEVAITAANFIADFGFLEFSLFAALATILKDNGTATHIILGHVNSFSFKLDIVMAFARMHAETSPTAKALVELEADIRTVSSFRNILAHGIYVAIEGEEGIGATNNMFVVGRGDPTHG